MNSLGSRFPKSKAEEKPSLHLPHGAALELRGQHRCQAAGREKHYTRQLAARDFLICHGRGVQKVRVGRGWNRADGGWATQE